MPRLSVQKNCQSVTDVIKYVDNETFLRPIYANNAISKVKFSGPMQFLGVRASNFDKSENSGE